MSVSLEQQSSLLERQLTELEGLPYCFPDGALVLDNPQQLDSGAQLLQLLPTAASWPPATEDECAVCFDERCNVQFRPCEHVCICSSCARSGRFDACVICRAPVSVALGLDEVTLARELLPCFTFRIKFDLCTGLSVEAFVSMPHDYPEVPPEIVLSCPELPDGLVAAVSVCPTNQCV